MGPGRRDRQTGLVSILSGSCVLLPRLTQALCKGHRPGPGGLIRLAVLFCLAGIALLKQFGFDRLQTGLVLSSSATHITPSYSEQHPSDLPCLAGKRFDFQPVIQTTMWVGIWRQMHGTREKYMGSDRYPFAPQHITDHVCELDQLISLSPSITWGEQYPPRTTAERWIRKDK